MSTQYPLGRREQFDDRSRAYPVRAMLTVQKPRSYTWSCRPVLNQGTTGTCVGHAWAHEIAARPNTWPSSGELAYIIYREATRIDPWPENDAGPDLDFGTSVLAGVKVAQAMGHYTGYRWAFGLDDLILALGYVGPAVLGIPWYESMFDPDANGLLRIGGQPVGGHAILANGVNVAGGLVRLHNSWGYSWGVKGEAFIRFEDLARLLREDGEACIPTRT